MFKHFGNRLFITSILLSLLCTSTPAFSQSDDSVVCQQAIDSIRTLIGKASGIERCKQYLELPIWYISLSDDQKALEASEEAFLCAKAEADSFYIVKATRYKAQLHNKMSKYNQAIDTYNEVLATARRNGFTDELMRILNNLGNLYSERGDYNKALVCTLESVSIREAQGDKKSITIAYNNIGVIYNRLKNIEKALEYYKKALQLRKEVGFTYQIGILLANIGSCERKLGNHERALEYINESFKECKQECDYSYMISYQVLGDTYLHLRDYKKAKNSLEQALALAEQQNNALYQAQSKNGLGQVAIKQEDFKKAKVLLSAAERIAVESGLKEILADIYKNIASLHVAMGNYKEGYIYQEKYSLLMDSVFQKEFADIIKVQNDLEQRENIKKIANKDKELALNALVLQKKTTQAYFLIAFIVIVLCFAGLFYWLQLKLRESNKKVNQQNLQLLELNATKDKFFSIISHDVRGGLNSIKTFSQLLVSNPENLSKEMIQPLALEFNKTVKGILSLLENLLQWSKSQTGNMDFTPEAFDLIPLLEFNKNLLQEQAKNKAIHIEIESAQPILTAHAHKESISAIVRNLISNAIKFTKSGGKVSIEAKSHEQEIIVTVADNGLGIAADALSNLFRIGHTNSTMGTAFEEGTGLGLILCKEFVEKNGGRIWAQSEEGKGSVFQFAIPVGKTGG